MACNSFLEVLENRQLLSAAPVLFNPTLVRDRFNIQIDLLKFKADLAVCSARLAVDYKAIHKATPAGDTSLNASFTQLHNDVKMMQSELAADRLTQQINAVSDEATIKLDFLQIKKDKGNATAESADRSKLTTDRVQLQTDLLAGLDSRIATRQSFETTISNDTQAIVTAADMDPMATAAMTGAVDKFAADRVACLDKFTSDLQTIVTARQKFSNDLTAARST